jgi:hypothetical protein
MASLTIVERRPHPPFPRGSAAAARPSRAREALAAAEVAELASRLLEARSEAARDHLLAATLTHAALRDGRRLTAPLGRALGRALKPAVAGALDRAALPDTLGLELETADPDERAFEVAQRVVRLAGHAARQVARSGDMAGTPRRATLSALQAAADVYGTELVPASAMARASSGRWVRRGGTIEVQGSVRASGPRPWVAALPSEEFEYDPEMEYFLGGLIRSAGRAVKSAVHAVGDLSSSVADTLGKVPIIGAGLKGLYGFTYGALIQSADSVVSGVRLDKVLSRHFESQIKNVKEVAPYVQTVISLVPGIGPGVSGAISAGLTLAQGRPISEALVDAAAGALPGGALAKSMAKMAFAAASGKPLSDIAVSALPLSPAAKDGLKAGLRVASDVAQGKRVDKALVAEANRQIDKLPPAFRTAAQVGVALGQGKKAQDIVVQQLPNLIRAGGPLAAAGQKIASSSPLVRQARGMFEQGRHGFDVAQGLMAHPGIPHHQIDKARQAFRGDALKAFDAAIAMHKGRRSLPATRHFPRPARLARAGAPQAPKMLAIARPPYSASAWMRRP